MASFLLFRKQIATVVGRNRPMAGIQKAAVSRGVHQLPAAGVWGTSLGPQSPSPSLVSPPGRRPHPQKVRACLKGISLLGDTFTSEYTWNMCSESTAHFPAGCTSSSPVTLCNRKGNTWLLPRLSMCFAQGEKSKVQQQNTTVWQSPGSIPWRTIPWGLNWVGLPHSQVHVTGSGADEAWCVHSFFCNSYLAVKLPNVRHERTVVLQARAVWAVLKPEQCEHSWKSVGIALALSEISLRIGNYPGILGSALYSVMISLLKYNYV